MRIRVRLKGMTSVKCHFIKWVIPISRTSKATGTLNAQYKAENSASITWAECEIYFQNE